MPAFEASVSPLTLVGGGVASLATLGGNFV